jgi:hypothetical protein
MRLLSGVGKIVPKWQSDPARHKEMPQEMIVTHSFVNQKKEVTTRSTAVLPSSVLSAFFFDAAGSLFHVPKGVGYH